MSETAEADPYVEGWRHCTAAIAAMHESVAQQILSGRGGFRHRLLSRLVAGAYRNAAKTALANSDALREALARDLRARASRDGGLTP